MYGQLGLFRALVFRLSSSFTAVSLTGFAIIAAVAAVVVFGKACGCLLKILDQVGAYFDFELAILSHLHYAKIL